PPAPRRPPTTPPRLPPKRQPGLTPQPPAIPPPGSRATAMWATEGVQPQSAGASVPYMGKLAAAPDEPAVAGRVRMAPGAEAGFDTGRVRSIDDDDDVLPARRGSRAGMV